MDDIIIFLNALFFKFKRKRLLPNKCIVNPNSMKNHDLFNSDDKNIILILVKFCNIVLYFVN